MPDDTTVRPLSERQLAEVRRGIEEVEPYARNAILRLLATIAQRDAQIEELRARVKELEDRVTSWEQDALRGSTGLAAWDWG